jgi:hypothetical protein
MSNKLLATSALRSQPEPEQTTSPQKHASSIEKLKIKKVNVGAGYKKQLALQGYLKKST